MKKNSKRLENINSYKFNCFIQLFLSIFPIRKDISKPKYKKKIALSNFKQADQYSSKWLNTRCTIDYINAASIELYFTNLHLI